MKSRQAPAQYASPATRQVAHLLDSAESAAVPLREAVANVPGAGMPAQLGKLLGNLTDKDTDRVLDAVDAGIKHYESEHGARPTADVVEAAIQQASGALFGVDSRGNSILDSTGYASSSQSNPIAMQPNRAVVAVISAIAEAIPFASYLPVDIASNESLLAILNHTAGSDFGDYAKGDIMDGVNCGGVYASAQRAVRFDITDSAPFTGVFSDKNLSADEGYCDPAGTGINVLRGRTQVFVNGIPAVRDSAEGSASSSPINGSFTLGGVAHVIVGTVNVTNGAVSITSVTPSLPVGTNLTAIGIVDYEKSPALIPSVIVEAQMFKLYANPWRVMTELGIDPSTQLRNELGLDAESEALVAIRNQMGMERHYQALRMAGLLGQNNVIDYDFDYGNQIQQKTRAQIWQDFPSVLASADQKMAEATMDHGITHLYVPSFIAAQWQGLPAELFESSGIAARPGVYRVGRLFGKYEVYYSPKCEQSNDQSTGKIIAIGRSSQVGRCPIVLGDAVAPTFLPLAMGQDLSKKAAMYARDYTAVNPHTPSALGCAIINVTAMK